MHSSTQPLVLQTQDTSDSSVPVECVGSERKTPWLSLGRRLASASPAVLLLGVLHQAKKSVITPEASIENLGGKVGSKLSRQPEEECN